MSIPTIYDSNTDEWRPVTQDEVNELVRIKAAYGHLRLMSQDVIAKSDDIALGKPAPEIEQDIEAYMIGEDVRQKIEYEKRTYGVSFKTDGDTLVLCTK